MNKQKLLTVLQHEMEQDLIAVKEAALTTLQAATHEESKAENQYDTRGLEASYLAGAQAKRAAEIEELLFQFKKVNVLDYSNGTPIGPTALVEVELNAKRSWILIMPGGGGLMLNFEGQMIQTVTPKSPLGEALVGLQAGETATVEAGRSVRDYRILTVL